MNQTRKLFNDDWTLQDHIGHSEHIQMLADIAESCEPPYVLGIHGDWGAGKTSFLRKLHLYLSAEGCGYAGAKASYQQLWEHDCRARPDIETIWFDAWHYQFENNPVVALLNEIRSHFTLSRKFLSKTQKISYSALMALDDLGKKIGLSTANAIAGGEKWEKDHFAQPLPSQMVKELMENAIDSLLENKKTKKKRLVIFVDDLDRCTGPVAFRFLEAMKIYFSLTNCVFVLGLDVRHVRRAVAAELKNACLIPESSERNGFETAEVYATDYLGKMFQHVYYLPKIPDSTIYLESLLTGSGLEDVGEWINIITEYQLLPSNPRRIKAFISSLILYVNQLIDRIALHNKKQTSGGARMILDKKLALIMTYLRVTAQDIYRILASEPDFWEKRLKEFCISGNHNDNWALIKITHGEEAQLSGEAGYAYQSKFPDPSDETLFRAAKLIREEDTPTEDEFNVYLF